jgi:long-chain fatty acid transport protein
MKMPLSFGYGMSFQTTSKLKLALDVIWTNWANAFDKMEMKLSNGTDPNINTMLGGPGFSFNFPLNWEDNVTVKIGGEYLFTNRFTFRAGYAYNNNPVPSSTLFPIFPAIVENHLTTGVSYLIGERVTINAAFEKGFYKKQTADESSAVQSEFSGSTSGLKTSIGHISFSYKL